MSEKKSMFDTMPPKFAFWAGVVTAVGAIALVGFVAMLMLVVKGVDLDSGKTTTKTANTNTTTNTNTGTTVSGSLDLDEDIRLVRGSGDLTVVEFSDIDCPFCKQFHTTMQQVVEEYDGQVAWAYNHFPLTSLHPNAEVGAQAAECAAQQDKYFDYLDAYFANSASAGDAKIVAVAEEVGLDLDAFASCRDSGETAEIVSTDSALARTLGCTGTPCSVVVDEAGEIVGRIPGALPFSGGDQSMTAILDSLLSS